MEFEVKYRDSSGKVQVDIMTAKNRAALISKLKGLNRVPISVSEHRQSRTANPKIQNRIALLSLLLVGCAVSLFFICSLRKSNVPKPTTVSTNAVAKTKHEIVKRVKTTPKQISVTSNTVGESSAPKRKFRSNYRVPVRIVKVSDKIEKRYYEDGSWETIAKPYALREGEEPPKRLFKNRMDNYLAVLAIPGEDVPPMPISLRDEDAARFLEQPIVVDMNNDSEDDIAIKNAVLQLRDELKEAMASGMSAEDYFEKAQSRQKTEADTVRTAKRMIQQELKAGNREMAAELLKKLNDHLAGKGIPPLVLTARMKQELGVEQLEGQGKENQ